MATVRDVNWPRHRHPGPPRPARAGTREHIRTQVTALNDLHNRIVSACWAKCVPRPRDADLAVAEMACIDRCVPKYLEAMEAVRKELATARGGRPVVGGV